LRLHHPTPDELDLPSVFHALSDPQRLGIVRQLARSDNAMPCHALGIDGTKSTLTHHMRVLREAGLIWQEPTGTTKFTSLRRADIDARFPGLLDAVLRTDEADGGRREPAGVRAEPDAAELVR
jgi:DNA-binding transcriptional ArsR family regulator